ncbi:ABC transporter ATP-binding protein [Paracoccus sp. S-4012]|uniref:ABC transporter ATP-binding protein n=1 Tax=Paracoccus sp. S-4012 TaxID=2665648 RepID=UPI00351AFAA7
MSVGRGDGEANAIRLKNVSVTYSAGLLARRQTRALDDVSLEIPRGRITGIVGESGSGKSTLSRVLLGLQRPASGSVTVLGEDPYGLSSGAWKAHRRKVQAVFQDSGASLNPRLTIGASVREGLDVHRIGAPTGRARRAAMLLGQVGLDEDYLERVPLTLSGGQRQRVNIARALAVEPEVLIADEPVSALDLSVQAQVLQLICRLQKDLGLTVLFISHDLSVVKAICDRIVVMRRGQVVEQGPTRRVLEAPQHPYTMQLGSDLLELPA